MVNKATEWTETEVSTRNCCNALMDGNHVRCKLSIPMRLNKANTFYQVETVLKSNKLLGMCEGCQRFDNSWGNGHK